MDPGERFRQSMLAMLAQWMGERFFRTFRIAEEEASPFDALLSQRDRRIGVTLGALWDESATLPGAEELGDLVGDEVGTEPPGYVVWIPPRVELPTEEPHRSNLRLALGRGMQGLDPGERREVRLPVRLQLAKIQDDGQYISVNGVLARDWTRLSEGVNGAFHLDARALHRLPEEEAELDIVISRVRDRAALLNAGEVTDVEVHDYWRVSRLPDGGPAGATVIGAPADHDPVDGTLVRRYFRRHVTRAVEQRREGQSDLSVLALVSALGRVQDELATAALRGMNPATYGSLDLIALIADGEVRQVLQPRRLPWEAER